MPKSLLKKTASFLKDESGASAIEYALIVSLVFLAIVTAVQGLGSANQDRYEKISEAVTEATM